LIFKIFVTDSLKVLTENTAKFAGGTMVGARFYDIINKQQTETETKSGDEIVADIVGRAGLELA